MTVILVSGAIATGKTAAVTAIAERLNAEIVRVREALHQVLGIEARDRQVLQQRGADLDKRTNGRWLRDYVIEHHDLNRDLVIDALRTRSQTLTILETLVDSRLVFFDAHEETRRARYAAAAAVDPVKASIDFDTAMHHPTESEVQNLRPLAQVIVATDDLTVDEVAAEVLRQLDLA